MTSKKKLYVIAAILVIGLGIGYVLWGGLEQNLVYFVTPTELLAKGKSAVGNPVRLGGVVAPGTIRSQASLTAFEVTDEKTNIPVETTKTPPQMFQEAMGVVVEGAMRADGKFEADRLMIKHGNEYRPPKEGEMPKEIYKELQKSGGTS